MIAAAGQPGSQTLDDVALDYGDGQMITISGGAGIAPNRLGRDWSSERYANDVIRILDLIYNNSSSGKALLHCVVSPKRMVKIRPQCGERVKTVPADEHDTFPKGERLRSAADRGLGAGLLRPPNQKGTGKGAAVEIYFTPAEHSGKKRPGETADEQLFHELIHAYRCVTATETCKPYRHQMNTVEEVIAISASNLYATERNRPLRQDHRGHEAINNTERWLESMREALTEFCSNDKSLAPRLAKIEPFRFNPFRACSPLAGQIRL